MEKKKDKKDSYQEIMDQLEGYYEGAPPINSQFAFDTCACKHEQENHICDEECKEKKKK
ncbi:TPA: hypothetical protein HA246_01845 [Candidatus Woesearchaeota archaeon]|nr:hypothetical protein [Candidatus Woesearchaeota archaeon]